MNEIKQSKKLKKGFLVTIEGGEGSGKSTQIKNLKNAFESKGYNVKVFREPGGSDFSEDIRNIFFKYNTLSVETSVFLMNAQRQHNIETIIKPYTEKGWVVIADRFTASTLVYQGLLNDEFASVSKSLIDFEQISLFFDCPPEIGLTRIAKNKRETNHFDDMAIEKHQRIYDGFKQLPMLTPEKHFWSHIIDATTTIETVKKEVVDLVEKIDQIIKTEQTKNSKKLTELIHKQLNQLV